MTRRRHARWLYHRLRQAGIKTTYARSRLGIRNHVVMR